MSREMTWNENIKNKSEQWNHAIIKHGPSCSCNSSCIPLPLRNNNPVRLPLRMVPGPVELGYRVNHPTGPLIVTSNLPVIVGSRGSDFTTRGLPLTNGLRSALLVLSVFTSQPTAVVLWPTGHKPPSTASTRPKNTNVNCLAPDPSRISCSAVC